MPGGGWEAGLSASTIYDVARRAGVSISTVSLAFNNPVRVTQSTLDRILAAADELSYLPKTEAVTRARRGVGRIGVMAPFTSYPSFARRLNGILRATRDLPWEIVVYDQGSAAATSPTLSTIPLTRRLDGLVIMSLPVDPKVAHRLVEQKLPTVLVDLEHPNFSSVAIADAEGGRIVAEHLHARGHTRLGCVTERKKGQPATLPQEARLDTFRSTLAGFGTQLPDSRIRRVDYGVEPARRAAHELLDLPEPPTAIFAHDDLIAVGVLKAARERGLRVPDELAVVGFDDSDVAEPLGLTTVRQPLEESGTIAIQTLLDQLSDPDRSMRHIVLRLTLVERDTT
uniref:Transcriptional regulator, LacI family n=1 Tax=Polymorphospora rubra TaxID=338584 RepID=A0A146J835_9ACTN|nr:transcriptional regulator, LacI family [Polymorphospora rubra]